jgi:hypothetical protein
MKRQPTRPVNALPRPSGGRCVDRRTALAIAANFFLTGGLAGCGYTVGHQFQSDVHSVHVPIFKSKSFRRGIEMQLTEAVIKRIQLETPFKVTSEEDAETRLLGKINDVKKSVLGKNQFDDARELNVTYIVDVTWEDLRTGKVLAHNEVPMAPEMVQFTSQASFAPEVGQSLATATQQAMDRMASDIVNMMQTPW